MLVEVMKGREIVFTQKLCSLRACGVLPRMLGSPKGGRLSCVTACFIEQLNILDSFDPLIEKQGRDHNHVSTKRGSRSGSPLLTRVIATNKSEALRTTVGAAFHCEIKLTFTV